MKRIMPATTRRTVLSSEIAAWVLSLRALSSSVWTRSTGEEHCSADESLLAVGQLTLKVAEEF